MMQSPIQKAEKFPATKPERMFRDAPPCLEQLVTSRTWRELVLTKILVNSGINAPATVPQLIMMDSTHHKSGSGRLLLAPSAATPTRVKSPNNTLLAIKVTRMDT